MARQRHPKGAPQGKGGQFSKGQSPDTIPSGLPLELTTSPPSWEAAPTGYSPKIKERHLLDYSDRYPDEDPKSYPEIVTDYCEDMGIPNEYIQSAVLWWWENLPPVIRFTQKIHHDRWLARDKDPDALPIYNDSYLTDWRDMESVIMENKDLWECFEEYVKEGLQHREKRKRTPFTEEDIAHEIEAVGWCVTGDSDNQRKIADMLRMRIATS